MVVAVEVNDSQTAKEAFGSVRRGDALAFDALPRRVTPKLAGYIISQWGALTALGF